MQPVGVHTGGGTLGPLSDAALSGTYMVQHVVSAKCKSIAFVYSNTGPNESDGANPITIKAAVKMADTGTLPMTFGGQKSVTLQPGCDVMTDPIACPVAAGSYVQSLTYVSVASGTWPGNTQIYRNFTKDGYASGADRTDGSTAGYDYTARAVFAPTLVLGETAVSRPVFGVLGDSIAHGTGDPNYFGLWERACSGVYGLVMIGYGGTQSTNATVMYGARHRYNWMAGCTDIINAYGRNDIGGGVTAVNYAVRTLSIASLITGIGSRCRQATILPGTTSSDSWATTANQTVFASESERVKVNDWIRGGSKVDGNGVALFDGTGTPSPLVSGFIDLADVVETARNSGKWKSAGSGAGGAYTTDGIHPTTLAHTALATTIAAWAATITV